MGRELSKNSSSTKSARAVCRAGKPPSTSTVLPASSEFGSCAVDRVECLAMLAAAAQIACKRDNIDVKEGYASLLYVLLSLMCHQPESGVSPAIVGQLP
jgi:hypothetical protein